LKWRQNWLWSEKPTCGAISARDRSVPARRSCFTLGVAQVVPSKGAFRLKIDEAAPAHMISWNAVVTTILAELNGGRPGIAALSNRDAFVRGSNGCLWHHGPRGRQDTGLPIVGVPAVVQGAVNPYDLFYRNQAFAK
jgi:hypothetical protein